MKKVNGFKEWTEYSVNCCTEEITGEGLAEKITTEELIELLRVAAGSDKKPTDKKPKLKDNQCFSCNKIGIYRGQYHSKNVFECPDCWHKWGIPITADGDLLDC